MAKSPRSKGKPAGGNASPKPAPAAAKKSTAPAKGPAKPAFKAKAAAPAKPSRGKPFHPPSGKPKVVSTLSHDQIASKAYEIWLNKGRPVGQDDQNWSEAKAALTK